MYQEEILKYYGRKDVQKAILFNCHDREVVGVKANGQFGFRPDAAYYEKDIEAMIKQGAVSLHGSIERWKNPLLLHKELKTGDLDKMRIGWDLIIDIDCDRELKYSKQAAIAVINTLETFDIKNYSIKYSGNRGFHIGVPFEIFPESLDFKPIALRYPAVPKMIIEYIEQYIEKDLREAFGVAEPFKILKLDTQVISSRHLFRLPYCLHRKTWRVSLPITKDQIMDFDPVQAEPQHVKVDKYFLESEITNDQTEAVELLQAAIFWNSRKKQEKREYKFDQRKLPEKAIPQNFFPPCINNIINGITDGKKRSVFILTTFLYNIGWKEDDIRLFIDEWNSGLQEPVAKPLIEGTLKNQRTRDSPQMAPNCANPGFYTSFEVCTPDEFCKTIKNPVTYTLNKVKRFRKYGGKRKVKEQLEGKPNKPVKKGKKEKKTQKDTKVNKEESKETTQSVKTDKPNSPSTSPTTK